MDIAVSVIVPVFNREDTIERCIKSIQRQTLGNIEIIVINDGSSDGTLSILESINDDRIKIISQSNSGQGYARNAGIEKAVGKYIAFVDSDDTIDEHMLEDMYKRAENFGADAVQCNILDIFPNSEERIQLCFDDKDVKINDTGAYADKYLAVSRHSYEVCNKLISRAFINEHGLRFRDTRKYFAEDLMFNLEMLVHLTKISFIDKPYYHYYQNPDSHMRSNYAVRLASICNLFLDYTKNADDDIKRAVSYTAAMVILYNTGVCAHSCRKEAMQVLSSSMLRKYIRTALGRRCRFKHRLLLASVYVLPVKARLAIVKKYSGRWER